MKTPSWLESLPWLLGNVIIFLPMIITWYWMHQVTMAVINYIWH
jgi:hypothetical protein